MKRLEVGFLGKVSGGAYITADYTTVVGPSCQFHDSMTITLPADGSLPPELKARIDSGASWDEVGPFLIMYSIIINGLTINT